jgi:hypothetical protein
MAYKGIFKPNNPKKYKGDPNKIVYRSLWELRCMRKFDTDDRIIWWASEELSIRYYCPVRKNTHRYFPDFIVHYRDANGNLNTDMIEVKPAAQTVAPIDPKTKDRRKRRRFIKEKLTFVINEAKWDAAERFCAERGWNFRKMTEKELGI